MNEVDVKLCKLQRIIGASNCGATPKCDARIHVAPDLSICGIQEKCPYEAWGIITEVEKNK